MPDYAGCAQKRCEKKTQCARYLMVFDQWQTMIHPDDPTVCHHFWDIKEGAPFKMDENKKKEDGDEKA